MKTVYKILLVSVFCGFLYLQYDLKSYTADYYTDSLNVKDSLKVINDSLELQKIKLAEGKLLYEKKCGRCHTLYEPGEFKQKEWKRNLNEMKEKAEITQEQYFLIYGYLSANCKK